MQLSVVSFTFFTLLRLNVRHCIFMYTKITASFYRVTVEFSFFAKEVFSFVRHNYSSLERGIHVLIKIQSLDLTKFVVNETAE